MDIIIVTGAAIVGAFLAAMLGWLESTEAFSSRKFARSVITAIISGITFAATYNYTQSVAMPMLVILAILGGVGIDTGAKKILGAVSAHTTDTTPNSG